MTPPPAPPENLQLASTDSGMVCPIDSTLVILVETELVRCPKCGRTWTAVGHLNFDFGWSQLEGPL